MALIVIAALLQFACVLVFIPCLHLAFEEQAPGTAVVALTPVLTVVAIFMLTVLAQRFE